MEEHPEQLEVLPAGQDLVDRGVLAREPDPAAYLLRIPAYVDAADVGRAAVGLEERGEHPDRRRLAGAVRAEQPVHRPIGDRQLEPVERRHLLEPLGQLPSLDRQTWFRHDSLPQVN